VPHDFHHLERRYVGHYDLGSSGSYERYLDSLQRISDGFNRIQSGEVVGGLGYRVVDSSANQSGEVAIVPSSLDVDDMVLGMTSVTGEGIAIVKEFQVDPMMQFSFDYLFEDPGEIEISIDDLVLDLLESPETGPGSPGSDAFGFYTELFDLDDMGFAPWSTHELQLKLKAAGDPTVYLDNLLLIGLPSYEAGTSQAVPEPSTWWHFAGGAVGLLLWGTRRVRRRRRALAMGPDVCSDLPPASGAD
jgi:hypothetical protein